MDTQVTRGSVGPQLDSARNKRPHWIVDLPLEKVNDLPCPESLSSLAKCTEEKAQRPGGQLLCCVTLSKSLPLSEPQDLLPFSKRVT